MSLFKYVIAGLLLCATGAYGAGGSIQVDTDSNGKIDETFGGTNETSLSGAGLITEAPVDGISYARKNGAWVIVTSGGAGSTPDGTITNDIVQWDGTQWVAQSQINGAIDDDSNDTTHLLSASEINQRISDAVNGVEYTLTVTPPSGARIVCTDPSLSNNIDCGTDQTSAVYCQATVPANHDVTGCYTWFVPGWNFVAWGGDMTGGGHNGTIVSMDGNKTASASYAQPSGTSSYGPEQFTVATDTLLENFGTWEVYYDTIPSAGSEWKIVASVDEVRPTASLLENIEDHMAFSGKTALDDVYLETSAYTATGSYGGQRALVSRADGVNGYGYMMMVSLPSQPNQVAIYRSDSSGLTAISSIGTSREVFAVGEKYGYRFWTTGSSPNNVKLRGMVYKVRFSPELAWEVQYDTGIVEDTSVDKIYSGSGQGFTYLNDPADNSNTYNAYYEDQAVAL